METGRSNLGVIDKARPIQRFSIGLNERDPILHLADPLLLAQMIKTSIMLRWARGRHDGIIEVSKVRPLSRL